MPIPDFQAFMRPVLAEIADGQIHDFNDVYQRVCDYFQLTPEEINERLPSGRQTVARNRASWARTYMGKAGLITMPLRRHMQITERGLKVLAEVPERLSVRYLKDNFPEFAEFHKAKPRGKADKPSQQSVLELDETTDPTERLQTAHAEMQQQLAADLLVSLKQVTPERFEGMVVELMQAMGYGGWSEQSGSVTQYSNDGGIDGVINEDPLGLDTIYLQAKRYTDNNIQRPEIDAFIGALTRRGARKGVFITTSGFSSGALEAVEGLNLSVILIDGQRLAELMMAHNLGVSVKETYQVKTLDSEYFTED